MAFDPLVVNKPYIGEFSNDSSATAFLVAEGLDDAAAARDTFWYFNTTAREMRVARNNVWQPNFNGVAITFQPSGPDVGAPGVVANWKDVKTLLDEHPGVAATVIVDDRWASAHVLATDGITEGGNRVRLRGIGGDISPLPMLEIDDGAQLRDFSLIGPFLLLIGNDSTGSAPGLIMTAGPVLPTWHLEGNVQIRNDGVAPMVAATSSHIVFRMFDAALLASTSEIIDVGTGWLALCYWFANGTCAANVFKGSGLAIRLMQHLRAAQFSATQNNLTGTLTDVIEVPGIQTQAIAAGVVTVPSNLDHLSTLALHSEIGGSPDDLDTINGGTRPMMLTFVRAGSDVITLKDGTGNLNLAGDFVTTGANDRIVLQRDVAGWTEISRATV